MVKVKTGNSYSVHPCQAYTHCVSCTWEMWALCNLGREQTSVVHYTTTSEINNFVMWLFAYGEKTIVVICRCLKYIAVSLPALYGGIMETVCLIWGDFLFLILQANFRRALSEYRNEPPWHRSQENRIESIGLCGKWHIRGAGSSKEMLKAPEACLKCLTFCGEHRIHHLKFSEESRLQLWSATSWVGFHCYSAIPLPFQAPANKFFFETVFSLTNHWKLKSTWRENSSLSGKAKNESWGNCGW